MSPMCVDRHASGFFYYPFATSNSHLPMDIPKEFFTAQSVLTLAGSSAAVTLICNGLQRATGYNPKWLGLVLALIFSLVGACQSADKVDASVILIGIVNGFLIYSTSTGANEVGGAISRGGKSNTPPANAGNATPRTENAALTKRPKREFFASWYD